MSAKVKDGKVLEQLIGIIEKIVAHSIAPHRLVQYVEKADDKHITDAAVAEFQFGDKNMRMIIVYKEGEGGQF